jgi:phage-related minor tail protein
MPDFQGPVTPEMAMKWLKSHQRAAGGPVARGAPYVVGERGPELFVPGISGRIIPANKTATGGTATAGGGQVVNNFHMVFQHTGLAADSPALQRDVVDAIRRYETRNGPVRQAG